MSEPLSKEQIDAIRARANAASPGPWMWQGGSLVTLAAGWSSPFIRPVRVQRDSDAQPVWDDNNLCLTNSIFIARAREDVPALLAHIDALEERLRSVIL